LTRVVIGVTFVMRVWGKLKVGAAAVAAHVKWPRTVMAKNIEPALFFFPLPLMFLESVDGVGSLAGSTRPEYVLLIGVEPS